MRKVFVIHFQPLEAYPPGMNFINYLSVQNEIQTRVSSSRLREELKLKPYVNDKAIILRPGLSYKKSFFRWVDYALFYLVTFVQIIRYRPHTVIYFETLSSWPALWYKKMRKNVQLMVHYHEYVSPIQYEQGMKLSKYMHKMEIRMYPFAYAWISQTNEERMDMFREDNKLSTLSDRLFRTIPNYPPKHWIRTSSSHVKENTNVKLVFVGSLGYKNMYLQELTDWVQKHDDLELDVYAYNIDQEAILLLKSCDSTKVRFHGGVDYDSLPNILKKYDVGIVMYKPFSENTVHAVSNKVFEYLACGLDVWFSSDMTYSYRYITKDVYPKVLAVDFSRLNSFDYKSAINKQGLKYQPSQYYYEKIYSQFLEVMLQ